MLLAQRQATGKSGYRAAGDNKWLKAEWDSGCGAQAPFHPDGLSKRACPWELNDGACSQEQCKHAHGKALQEPISALPEAWHKWCLTVKAQSKSFLRSQGSQVLTTDQDPKGSDDDGVKKKLEEAEREIRELRMEKEIEVRAQAKAQLLLANSSSTRGGNQGNRTAPPKTRDHVYVGESTDTCEIEVTDAQMPMVEMFTLRSEMQKLKEDPHNIEGELLLMAAQITSEMLYHQWEQ